MIATWSLDDLYPSFSDARFTQDLKKTETIAEKYELLIQQFMQDHLHEREAIETYLNYRTEDSILLQRLQAFGHLSFTTNSKCQDAIHLKSKIADRWNTLTAPHVAFKFWLKEVQDLDALAQSSKWIEEHLFYLNEIKNSAQYMLSEEEEILISKLSTTGSTAWEMIQSKVSSQLTGTVNLKGELKEMPIMAIRNLAFSPDVEVRKAGYEAELLAYEKHAEISAAALNGIKGEVITLSELRGYESPLHETLINSRMTPEILQAMISAIEDYLPEFRRYLKLKSKFLGNQNGLPFYDLFAPVSSEDKNYSIDEARAFIIKYFGDFSPELADFAQRAFDQRWIDFEPKEGKVGGAFCSNLASIGQSRVLTNFTGKLKNVLTLAHELGHAFHGDRIMKESILNTSYPMPLAETASIFCETIVRNAVLKDAPDELALAILENSLQSATQVTVDILSRYYFETAVFETRKDHPLSTEEYKKLMLDAQKKSYGDGLDENHLHPYMWLNKTHYYYSKRNFYNFPYAFGLLFARGLYAKYQTNPAQFITAYDQLLCATGKMDIQAVCALMDIDPSSKAFWVSSLEKIKCDIDKFEEIIQ